MDGVAAGSVDGGSRYGSAALADLGAGAGVCIGAGVGAGVAAGFDEAVGAEGDAAAAFSGAEASLIAGSSSLVKYKNPTVAITTRAITSTTAGHIQLGAGGAGVFDCGATGIWPTNLRAMSKFLSLFEAGTAKRVNAWPWC